MQFTDTHCHIQSAGTDGGERMTHELWEKGEFDADTLRARANEAGVDRLLCVGCDLPDSKLAVNYASGRDKVWASIGIHPHEAKDYAGNAQRLAEFAALASDPKVVAVGECGLDFYYNHSPKAEQLAVLRFQIELALEHDLPMIFHVRDAFEDFWPVFDDYKGIRGVIHSFSSGPENLAEILKRGLHVGLNGIMTFTKKHEQLEAAKAVPLDRLLLETDAPFLTPTPYRGKLNEPQYVAVTANFLSQLRQEPLEKLAAATTDNAVQLFNLG